MAISSRQDLIDYALRKLGDGVLQINITPDQINDCIDDGLRFMVEHHYDAVEKIPLKYTITPTDFTNRYITIPTNIVSIFNILPLNSGPNSGIFNVNYQILLSDIQPYGTMDLVSYSMSKQYLNLASMILNPAPPIRFNRRNHLLHIDTDWPRYLPAGTIIILEVYAIVDPEEYPDLYDDFLLKKYVVALLERQWGRNLSKFKEVKLPGGVVLNGQEIFERGDKEVKEIEKEIQSTYEFPAYPLIG